MKKPTIGTNRDMFVRKGGIVLKRRFLLICILIVALTVLSPAALAQMSFEDCVRLHIIAENDTDRAQALKIRVRDSMIGKVQALFEDCENDAQAWDIARENIALIEAWAKEAANENGYEGPLSIELEYTEGFTMRDKVEGDLEFAYKTLKDSYDYLSANGLI